jgi:hypothetical protein
MSAAYLWHCFTTSTRARPAAIPSPLPVRSPTLTKITPLPIPRNGGASNMKSEVFQHFAPPLPSGNLRERASPASQTSRVPLDTSRRTKPF